jgi:hypothetical protein
MFSNYFVDFFATKGIEYIIVIGFFILIIPFWKYLNTPSKKVKNK